MFAGMVAVLGFYYRYTVKGGDEHGWLAHSLDCHCIIARHYGYVGSIAHIGRLPHRISNGSVGQLFFWLIKSSNVLWYIILTAIYGDGRCTNNPNKENQWRTAYRTKLPSMIRWCQDWRIERKPSGVLHNGTGLCTMLVQGFRSQKIPNEPPEIFYRITWQTKN